MFSFQELETGSFLPPHSEFQPKDSIRIVSWNINRGLQLDGVLDFLRKSAADLILLQEVDINARRTRYRNVARDIAHALKMNYVFGCEFEELTQGNPASPAYHGQATLSHLPLSDSRILRFRRQSNFWHPRWFIPRVYFLQRRFGARMALVSHADCGGRPLTIYNVHFESRGADSLRWSQLADIVEDLGQYSPEVPIVVAGDFNFNPYATGENGDLCVSEFHNPFGNGDWRPTTTGFRFRRARAIDWILSKGPVAWSDPILHNTIPFSDHYPLSVTLRWA